MHTRTITPPLWINYPVIHVCNNTSSPRLHLSHTRTKTLALTCGLLYISLVQTHTHIRSPELQMYFVSLTRLCLCVQCFTTKFVSCRTFCGLNTYYCLSVSLAAREESAHPAPACMHARRTHTHSHTCTPQTHTVTP